MRLSQVTSSHENNFNLIRLLAAWAVLVSHSYALAIGSGQAEPLRRWLKMTPGSIGVDIFFIISGFLVTGSMLRRHSMLEFLWARALRIYPALWVMLVIVVGLIGAGFTTVSLHDYFSSRFTLEFVLRNAVLFGGISYVLPGVFEDLPYPKAVNGSLWTMYHELRMYTLLACAWMAMLVLPRSNVRAFRVLMILVAAFAAIANFYVYFAYPGEERPFWHLCFMFFSGASMYVLREKVSVTWSGLWLAAIAILVSTLNVDVFFVVYSLSLGYLLLCLAYVPEGAVRKYNKLGDYSYGIYIYAFPVQQSVVALNPGISPGSLIVWSSLITLALAVVSWTFLERHMLDMKPRCVTRTRQWFGLKA